MTTMRVLATTLLSCLLVGLAGCATRPVNPPIKEVAPNGGYDFQSRQKYDSNKENLVILAFSGGGTRAAAFSYGVLEYLHRTEIVKPDGSKFRLIDGVDIITGVSPMQATQEKY